MNPYTFRRLLVIFHNATGRNLLIRHLQIFSGTQHLSKDFFDIVRHLFVTLRAVTITVRYIDNQGWQDGSTLVANGDFVEEWQIPHAVQRITIEFENLLTRRHDVDRLVKEAAIKWRFRRQEGNNPYPPHWFVNSMEGSRKAMLRDDGKHLTPDYDERKSTLWTRCSTINDKRWLRDENRGNELDLYTVAMTWDDRCKTNMEHLPNLHPMDPNRYRDLESEAVAAPARTQPHIIDGYRRQSIRSIWPLWTNHPSGCCRRELRWAETEKPELNPEVCVWVHPPSDEEEEAAAQAREASSSSSRLR